MEFDINNALTYPRRQVHLDFHTQPDLKNVGAHFRKEQFQSALREGNVSSITVFARCYHGLCYYPTDVGPSPSGPVLRPDAGDGRRGA